MLRECRLLAAGGKGVTCRMQAAGRRAREDQLFALGANRVLLVGGLGSLISCRRSPRRALLFYVLCCLPECTEGDLVQRLHRFSGVCTGCWGTGASKPPKSHDRGTACERVWADAAGRRHFAFAHGHAHTLDHGYEASLSQSVSVRSHRFVNTLTRCHRGVAGVGGGTRVSFLSHESTCCDFCNHR